jgi:hypothetical protein
MYTTRRFILSILHGLFTITQSSIRLDQILLGWPVRKVRQVIVVWRQLDEPLYLHPRIQSNKVLSRQYKLVVQNPLRTHEGCISTTW